MNAPWDWTYARLPERLFSWVTIQPSPDPELVLYNQALAQDLGLRVDFSREEAGLLTGVPGAVDRKFLSQAYAGHQFGQFNNLGDGRAALLGEWTDPQGLRWDLQFKGSGPTPYSRQGDGKAALGPMLREYLVGEALHARNIPTTRVLSVALTGEEIWRNEPLPGALALRAAHSHIRVGTFQFAGVVGGPDLIRSLADYTLDRHYPEARREENPYLALFQAVARRQARLIALWMGAGFVHGVMNTDNMALSGQSLDFGPCAFLDGFNPGAVFSSIDRGGRYAYGNQPGIAQWNLARLAETFIPLLGDSPEAGLETAQQAVDRLPQVFLQEQTSVWASKLGLEPLAGASLIGEYLEWLEEAQGDFTRAFRALADLGQGRVPDPEAPLPGAKWLEDWTEALRRQGTLRGDWERWNPLYSPRNHWMEEALLQAQEGDWEAFRNLERAVRNPSSPQAGLEYLAGPGPRTGQPYVTYCGT